MPLPYILQSLWTWFINTGFSLALLIVLAFLVPRFGRIAMRIVERQVADEHVDESKTHLAFAGVAVYIAQVIAYFIIFVFILQKLGFSLAGAAIPATAASAAIGLGAQSIIADFLAGFFILSEKQYGVGDWVRFEGGATTAEGTVIQITMRSTRIRTLAEETVIIPNSKAGVSINNSNYWSRAVVTMPIPLLGSSSIQEAIQRSTNAARRALRRDGVAQEVLGELTVHESVDVDAPATVGSPWTVSMRFLCQVKPGSQWKVERAIRTSLIDEFWAEYGSAPTLSGAVASTLTNMQDANQMLGLRTPSVDPTPTGAWPATTPLADTGSGEDAPAGAAEELKDPAASDAGTNSATDFVRPQDENDSPSSGAPQTTVLEPVGDTEADGLTEEDEKPHGFKRLITVGGRTRVSTAVLLLLFFVLLVFKGLTLQTADSYNGQDGWLAPAKTATTQPTATSPTLPPAPETQMEETPTLTTSEQTPESTPSETYSEQAPASSAPASANRQNSQEPTASNTSTQGQSRSGAPTSSANAG